MRHKMSYLLNKYIYFNKNDLISLFLAYDYDILSVMAHSLYLINAHKGALSL